MSDLLAEQEATDPTARFLAFHRENPRVYQLLVREARRYREATGATKCGIGLLWERLRWLIVVETTDESPRLNDHYCPFYARLLMAREADLRTFFDVRAAGADDDTTWIGRAA